MDGGRPVSTQPLDRVRLCHYAVRSVAQYERASTEILLLQDRLSQLQRELGSLAGEGGEASRTTFRTE